MRLRVEVSRDTPAVAEISVELRDKASRQEIMKACKDAAITAIDNGLMLSPTWEFFGSRITAIRSGNDYISSGNILLEESPFDLGAVVIDALAGRLRSNDPLAAIVMEAERQGITVDPAIRKHLMKFSRPRRLRPKIRKGD